MLNGGPAANPHMHTCVPWPAHGGGSVCIGRFWGACRNGLFAGDVYGRRLQAEGCVYVGRHRRKYLGGLLRLQTPRRSVRGLRDSCAAVPPMPARCQHACCATSVLSLTKTKGKSNCMAFLHAATPSMHACCTQKCMHENWRRHNRRHPKSHVQYFPITSMKRRPLVKTSLAPGLLTSEDLV